MDQNLPRRQMSGFLFTAVLGTFFHFFFDLTGGSVVAALISAVNESIFEHMKLIYYPMLLFALLQYRQFGNHTENFWCVKLAGILVALALIPSLYYLYTGALGVSADWFNVTIFFIAAAVGYWTETKLFQGKANCRPRQSICFALILAIGVIFTVFTFFPPRVPLFRDPLTGTYGFKF